MLQELAARSGAQGWAIASMLFFVLVFSFVALLAWRTEPAVADRCARLPLAGDDPFVPGGDELSPGADAPEMG